MNKISKKEYNKLLQLVIGVILVITILGYIAFKMYKKNADDDEEKNIWNFLGLKINPDDKDKVWKGVLLGMSSGIVFGFIDNAGLWFGMDALNPFLETIPGIGDLTKAGLGNTFSDAIGAFAGTFAGIIIKGSIIELDEKIPEFIWAEAIGVIIGCLLGILIPRMITGKR
tara:strand:+ start:131 stop:640 length:510 start_codon:yes stop_codon:yes gene_type:complete